MDSWQCQDCCLRHSSKGAEDGRPLHWQLHSHPGAVQEDLQAIHRHVQEKGFSSLDEGWGSSGMKECWLGNWIRNTEIEFIKFAIIYTTLKKFIFLWERWKKCSKFKNYYPCMYCIIWNSSAFLCGMRVPADTPLPRVLYKKASLCLKEDSLISHLHGAGLTTESAH